MTVIAKTPRVRDKDRTRKLLKTATMTQILSSGYAELSVKAIVEAAGVSKGALFHHFPTKDHLVAEAYGDMLVQFAQNLREASKRLRAGGTDIDGFIEHVLSVTTSGHFVGCMEIALGIRVNNVLNELVQEPVAEWRVFFDEFWEDTFHLPGKSNEAKKAHWALASNVLRGYSFGQSFGPAENARKYFTESFKETILKHAKVNRL